MKPCPYCGSQQIILHLHKVDDATIVAYECDNCSARGPKVRNIGLDGAQDKIKLARNRWNNRYEDL